jgi:cholestenol delta-isomerase
MAAHPYYPPDAVIPGYRANTWPAAALAGVFAAASAAVVATTLLVVGRARPALSRADRATVVWFVLSGCIHVVFEGKIASGHPVPGGRRCRCR